MNQATLALDTPASPVEDRTAFDIGWDHAAHGLVPPAGCLHPDNAVCQGWMAGKAVFGRRTLHTRRHTRRWLALRLQAWREGLPFETLQVTPHLLTQIDSARCPVLRQPLSGMPQQDDGHTVQPLAPKAGFVAGNLAVMSHRAAEALRSHDTLQALQQARRGEDAGTGLDSAAWLRVAALRAMTTPLPFALVAALPLAVLPPNRVRLVNPAQALQALVTRTFASDGWAERCRGIAALLPAHSLRTDFNLFVGAMAPRVLEAGHAAADRQPALEDAWLDERVQRRWQHLVLSLGEAGCHALLDAVAALPIPGVTVLQHADTATPVAPEPASASALSRVRRAADADLAVTRRAPRRGTAWRSSAVLQPVQPAQEQLHHQGRQ